MTRTARPELAVAKYCADKESCGSRVPDSRGGNAKYCSKRCYERVQARKKRAKQRTTDRVRRIDAKDPNPQPVVVVDRATSKDGRASARRGRGYTEEFLPSGLAEPLRTGETTVTEVASSLGTSSANVSRWLEAYREDVATDALAAEHEPDLSHTDDLGSFTRRYFPKLLVPDIHLEWEQAIDETVGTGGRLLLLASQRHGKSEMLIRYCMKRIAQDPNISIGWVSKTQSLAEKMVGYIRQNLEFNEQFIHDVLGPGQTFMPPTRSGYSWTNGEFTIGNRTELRKSPTMVALGVGGTIIGRDFDLIIIDDPQDRARCVSPSQREKDREWFFTDFLSRKEEHTGVAFIMSRQHVDDLPGKIMRDHAEDWDIRIYRAHDPGCTVPEAQVDAHTDCVLWPEKRSWKWLYHQKQANEAHFQRNYQNDPKTDATVFLTATDIDELKDPQLTAGFFPPGSKLVAGIDPASGKPTAATLWAYTREGKRLLVDAELASAGNKGVMEILDAFAQGYGCRKFIIETNGYQGQVMQDTAVRQMATALALHLKPHYTSRVNKWDDASGVVAMLHGLRAGEKYLLPGSGAREVMDRLELVYRQWLLFDPDFAGHKHADDDLVMASWFPQTEMDSWDVRQTVEVVSEFDATTYSGTSYGKSVRYAGVR